MVGVRVAYPSVRNEKGPPHPWASIRQLLMGQEPSTRTDQNSQVELEPLLESSFPSLASLALGFYPLDVGEGIGRSSGVASEICPPTTTMAAYLATGPSHGSRRRRAGSRPAPCRSRSTSTAPAASRPAKRVHDMVGGGGAPGVCQRRAAPGPPLQRWRPPVSPVAALPGMRSYTPSPPERGSILNGYLSPPALDPSVWVPCYSCCELHPNRRDTAIQIA